MAKKPNRMVVYNKLVRDRIPGIIRDDGGVPVTQTLDRRRTAKLLVHKLFEEGIELLRAKTVAERTEEIADILEIVQELARRLRIDLAKAERVRDEKSRERGGFKKGIYLKEVRSGNKPRARTRDRTRGT